MSLIRFDSRVAIVTGGGNGLGRQYSIELAKLGCKVIVNDLGGLTNGEGKDTKAADNVVKEIEALGGKAVADYNSVVDGAKIVETAIKNFGRIDIVINNAGILRDVSFTKMTHKDWNLLISVHLTGSFAVTHAAWPYMMKQKYGRIIMVTSAAGLYGNFGQAHYSAVKMGLVGLANTLSLEGAKNNIFTNVIAPLAGSRMTETVLPPDLITALKPEYVSPLVIYLCSEKTKSNGGIFEVGAGWISKLRWERTKGKLFKFNEFKPENIENNWDAVCDFTDSTRPNSPRDAFASVMENLANNEAGVKSEITIGQKPNNNKQSLNSSTVANKSTHNNNNNTSNIDIDAIMKHSISPQQYTYTTRDVILYALGIGAGSNPLDQSELKFIYENNIDFVTFPTFGVIIPSAAISYITDIPGLKFNPMALLHGEQYCELKQPFNTIPTQGTVTNYTKISGIYDKRTGALLTLDVITKDENGKEILFNQYSLFIRGLGGFGGSKGPIPVNNEAPKDIPPTVIVREKVLENQAALYRLSGDYNPLHIDPDMAKVAGFNQPILHGLCSFGYAARAVIKHFCNNDVRLFKSIRVKFVKHVFPGETLITECWQVNPHKIIFRVKVAERGEYVIDNAAIELHNTNTDTNTNTNNNNNNNNNNNPSTATKSSSVSKFKSSAIFETLKSRASPELVSKVKGTFLFNLQSGSEYGSWLLDLKTGNGSVNFIEPSVVKDIRADCILNMNDSDFVDLMTGKLNAQQGFMQGKIKIKGNVMLAQKLQLIQPSKAKL